MHVHSSLQKILKKSAYPHARIPHFRVSGTPYCGEHLASDFVRANTDRESDWSSSHPSILRHAHNEVSSQYGVPSARDNWMQQRGALFRAMVLAFASTSSFPGEGCGVVVRAVNTTTNAAPIAAVRRRPVSAAPVVTLRRTQTKTSRG
jgi:hypothetical protein